MNADTAGDVKASKVEELIAELTKEFAVTGRTRNAVELKLANIDAIVSQLQPQIRRPFDRLIQNRDGSHYQRSLSTALRSALRQRGLLMEEKDQAEVASRRATRKGDWTDGENSLIVARYLELQDQLSKRGG